MSKSLIGSFIFALSFFVLFSFVLPSYNNVMHKKEQIKIESQKLALKIKAQKNIDKLFEEYQSRIGDAKRVSVFIPAEKGNDYVVSSIQSASSQSGMSLKSISVLTPKDNANTSYVTTNVELSMIGSYEGLNNMLNTLENSLRIYDIKSINIQNSKSLNELDISLEITTYTLR